MIYILPQVVNFCQKTLSAFSYTYPGNNNNGGFAPPITPNYKGESPFIIPQKQKEEAKEQRLTEEEKASSSVSLE